MKKLFVITLGLLICASLPVFGQKIKVKHKEKRFEPVVKENLADYAGRYIGFDNENYLEVRTDGGGQLLITSHEGNRQAVLQDIRIENARVMATKVYTDGHREQFAAVFGNRILNGQSAFGLLVEGPVRIDETTVLERIFYRRD